MSSVSDGNRHNVAVFDSDGIGDLHERLIIETADALSEGLGDRAMQIHLQRIVGENWKPLDRPVGIPTNP